MNSFVLISLEWSCYNGINFQFIHLDLYKPVNLDNSLFGINIGTHFLTIDLFWTTPISITF